jgi:pimeloyl-ACP methyl ester carboxylesterase
MSGMLTIDADAVRAVASALGYIQSQLKNDAEQLTWQLSTLEAALQYAEVGVSPHVRQAITEFDSVSTLLQTAQARLMEVVNDTLHLEVDIDQGGQSSGNSQPGFLSYGGLYSLIDGSSKQPSRIAITQGIGPDGQPVLLVTLRGLDLGGINSGFHLSGSEYRDYNLPNALLGGLDENNAFKQDVENSIQQYLAEHGLPPNTQIIIAGHSFGGIVAQQLVEDAGQTHFNIKEVITYGSPNLGVNWGQTTHHMFADRYDFVPLLSLHENSGPLGLLGAIDQANPINMGGRAVGMVTGFFHGLDHGGLREAFKEGSDWGFMGGNLTALPGTVAADALINQSPLVKHLYTGETIVAGQGDSQNPLAWFTQDHGAYSVGQIYGGGTLQGTPVDFQIYDLGQTEYFDSWYQPSKHFP